MTERTLRRVHVGVLSIAAPLFVAVVVLSIRNGSFGEDGAFIGLAMLMIVGYVSLASLLIRRQPTNAVGWLMLAIGLAFLVGGGTDEYSKYAYRTSPDGLPLRELVAWLGNWVFILFVGAIPFLCLLFPTGRVLGPRWRLVMWLAAVAIVGSAAALILQPGPLDTDHARIENPTGVPSLAGFVDVLEWVAGLGLLLAAILAAASLVVRARRSSGEERQQVRWFAYATVVGLALLVLTLVVETLDASQVLNEVLFYLFFVVLAFGFPGAIAVAILRYRLYDLDLVIKKTLVFGVLVALLTAVSVLLVVVVGALVGRTGLLESRESGFIYFFTLGALIVPLWRLSKRLADRLVYGGRASPYEVLTEFSDRMADAYATDDVLPRMARIAAEAAGAEHAEIWLRIGNMVRPTGAWPEPPATEPIRIAGDALPDLGAGETFEVRHQGELLGAITLTMPANDPMNPSKARLVRDLAAQAGLVLRNVRLIEELRASRQRLVSAQDEERRKLERNIHDGAQQQLVALAVKLRLADGLVERDPVGAHALLHQLQSETSQTLEDLRDLARGIYPPLLADEGLASALEAQARRAAIPVEVETSRVGRYPQDVEAVVYFSCLEALGNIAKHARATRAAIRLEPQDGVLRFEVRDDGVGFDPVVAGRGTGLQGIADRLEAIGGALEFESAPGKGTTMRGTVPVGGGAR
jgi:signal transduction histidine kinase